MRPAVVAMLLLLAGGSPVHAWPWTAKAPAGAPKVIMVPTGEVQVRAAPAAAWTAVSAETPMSPGSEVRTSAGASAELRFSDGSILALGSKSHFAVDRADGKEASFSLKTGRLRAMIIGYMSGRVNFRMPTAVAAVRGTVFDLSAEEGGKSEVSVAEGHLEVQDNKGRNAVVTAEETVSIGAEGMEPPRMVALTDERAQGPARPFAVAMELGRDNARKMIEELRNRELKANEAQLGKDVIDAFGKRVRLEEYVLRPANNEFKLVFISHRESSLDWGHLLQRFNSKIPDDLTQVPALVAGSFFSKTMPANWVKYTEVYMTNTTDGIKETIDYGNPVPIDFSGFGAAVGTRYYPSSIDYKQYLAGPGVPGGLLTVFQQKQAYNDDVAHPNQMAWTQKLLDGTNSLAMYAHFHVNLGDAADVAGLQTDFAADNCAANCYGDDVAGLGIIDPTTVDTYPSGAGKADFQRHSTYASNDWVSTEKILVNNEGKVFDFANPDPSTFEKEGNWNLEVVAKSSFFQGRKIDVLIAPEILTQTKQAKTAPSATNPGG